MKENKYDDPDFFAEYSTMSRSVEGLSGAGEWHQLKMLLPDFAGKELLDLGCGFGWHCTYAVRQGAKRVVGVDISEKMLARARAMTDSPKVSYLQRPIEEYPYPPTAFDIVLSSLAFHYVADFPKICRGVAQTLRPGGDFVFSVEHPVFTAYGNQDWYRDVDDKILHWPVDRYYEEGVRTATFLGETITKYHRTLTTYLNTLLQTGFALRAVEEAVPPQEMLADDDAMQNELRRPMMLLVSARKSEGCICRRDSL